MKLLTRRELSEKTGVSIDTLKYWTLRGKIPKEAVHRVGRKCYYKEEGIKNWLAV